MNELHIAGVLRVRDESGDLRLGISHWQRSAECLLTKTEARELMEWIEQFLAAPCQHSHLADGPWVKVCMDCGYRVRIGGVK
jgi:chemotaxis regulatin CheY-phosphate phosphatase CheZ